MTPVYSPVHCALLITKQHRPAIEAALQTAQTNRARSRVMTYLRLLNVVKEATAAVAERGFAGRVPPGTKVVYTEDPGPAFFSPYKTTELVLAWSAEGWVLERVRRVEIDPTATRPPPQCQLELPHDRRLSELLSTARHLGYSAAEIQLIEGALILYNLE